MFKPKRHLRANDVYQTKLQVAQQTIQELMEFGFRFSLVLADSLYLKFRLGADGSSQLLTGSERQAKMQAFRD